jgi:hypothetical protein
MLRAAGEIENDPRVIRPRPQPNGMYVHAMTGGGLPRARMIRGRTTGSGMHGRGDYSDAEHQRA